MSGGPDFICIGAEKAGTTWLYDNIRHHPDVWLPPPPFKELHYFNDKIPNKQLQHLGKFNHGDIFRRYSPLLHSPRLGTLRWLWRFNHHKNDSMQWYKSLFAVDNRLCGDITPLYSTLDERGVEFVKQTVKPECRIVLILRDPVTRFWSSIKMLYRYENNDIRKVDAGALVDELSRPYMALKSDYTRMIKTWEAFFPREQFGIFYYDDLVRDNRAFLENICRFIGVDCSDWSPPALDKRSNRDKHVIRMPEDLEFAVSEFYLAELRDLSEMIDGHATTWLQNARNSLKEKTTA